MIQLFQSLHKYVVLIPQRKITETELNNFNSTSTKHSNKKQKLKKLSKINKQFIQKKKKYNA